MLSNSFFRKGRNKLFDSLCGWKMGFPGGSDGLKKKKKTPCNVGDSLIPGSERSPGEENGNPLQYSWLENSMDRGDWLAIVHGVTKSQTQLSDWHTTLVAENAQWPLYFAPRCTLVYISASPEDRTSRSEDSKMSLLLSCFLDHFRLFLC